MFLAKSTLQAANFGYEGRIWPAGRSLPTPELDPYRCKNFKSSSLLQTIRETENELDQLKQKKLEKKRICDEKVAQVEVIRRELTECTKVCLLM